MGSQDSLIYASIDAASGALGPPTDAKGSATNAVDYPSIAADAAGRTVWALHTTDSTLNTFRLSGPGVQATRLSTISGLNLEQSLSLHPSGKFLFVEMSGSQATIETLRVDVSSGVLTVGSKVTADADLRMTAIDRTGKFLFANDLTQGRIFEYQVNQTDGSLALAAKSPVSLPVDQQPTSVAIAGSISSPYLVANLYHGGIAVFSIDTSSGALAEVAGSPFMPGVSFYNVVVDPSGIFVYGASAQDGSIYEMSIDPSTGALSDVPASPMKMPSAATFITITLSGKYLYAQSNITNSAGTTSVIYGFSVNPANGQLTALSNSPFPSVPYPVAIAPMRVP